jgi:hypothetical protein
MDNTELALQIGEKLDKGFSAIHEKIDTRVEGLRHELIEHQTVCNRRFQAVETEVRVKTAIAEVVKSAQDKAIWPKIKTAVLLSAAVAVTAAAAKVLLAHTNLF